jgi:hypothetical protein
LQCVGERQGSALDPLKPFLKEGFKNPKNFKKIIYQCFLKVLGSPETLLQKGFWWGAGATPLPCKPKFANKLNHYRFTTQAAPIQRTACAVSFSNRFRAPSLTHTHRFPRIGTAEKGR